MPKSISYTLGLDDTSFCEGLDRYLEDASQRHIDFLQRLLQIPCPRGGEGESIRFVKETLEAARCEVAVFEGEMSGGGSCEKPSGNLYARLPSQGGGGRGLMLEAHLDVVPPGDLKRSKHDPWGGAIEEGRIYARGAHDDRTGVAILCLLAQLLRDLEIKTAGDIHFLVVTDEEYASGGMRAFLRRFPDICPGAHLLVDGNENANQCIIGHPASLSFTIEIPGPYGTVQNRDYAHAANPIELAGGVIAQLARFERQLSELLKNRGADAHWPPPTVAVTSIESDGWFSNVPERCTLSGWCNVIPPLTPAEFKTHFENHIDQCCQGSAWFREHPMTVRWGPVDVPSMFTSTDSDFYQVLARSHLASFGSPLVPRVIGGWGDIALSRSPQRLFYGPGSGGNCHAYDEYYELKDLRPIMRTLAGLVVEWCQAARTR
jgi:acetylornithine deacetylase